MNKEKHHSGISVIIPVYHEEEYINSAVSGLPVDNTGYSIEILVVDGSKRKNTLEVINNKGVIKIASPKGRAVQMNTGASRAGKDILLFLHADTELPENAFDDIVKVFDTTDSVAGAFTLSLDNPGLAYRLIGTWASLKHRLTRIPYGDQAIFIKKDYFQKIGGYTEIPLMEDVDLMKRIKKQNDSITILRTSVKTSARKWEEEGVLRRILSNYLIQAMFLFGVSPQRLARYYYGEEKNE